VTGAELSFVVPWSIEERTGGTIYDARMVAGLRDRGWDVVVLDLGGDVSTGAVPGGTLLAEALARVPDDTRVVIDALALAGKPQVADAERSRIRIIALVHQVLGDVPGLEASRRAELHALERAALSAAHGVIATSAFSARRLADIGVEPSRIRVVMPGTDRALPATGPSPGRPPQLLCVGPVTHGKGQDVLVRALARVVELPWTCLLVGDLRKSAGFVDQVRAVIEQAGLSDRIEMLGPTEEDALEALYQSSSVFVLPSRYEAYGMALTEAMAHGLPVVSTIAGAIPETVPSHAAILVPPGDDDALADALRSLLADPAEAPGSASKRRHSLGMAGSGHASTLPTWDQAVDRFAAAIVALAA
jgi:glycosyltransferase involved in cell wall biosynthesis